MRPCTGSLIHWQPSAQRRFHAQAQSQCSGAAQACEDEEIWSLRSNTPKTITYISAAYVSFSLTSCVADVINQHDSWNPLVTLWPTFLILSFHWQSQVLFSPLLLWNVLRPVHLFCCFAMLLRYTEVRSLIVLIAMVCLQMSSTPWTAEVESQQNERR